MDSGDDDDDVLLSKDIILKREIDGYLTLGLANLSFIFVDDG